RPGVNRCRLILGVVSRRRLRAASLSLHLRIIRAMVLHHGRTGATATADLAGQARHAAGGLGPGARQALPDRAVGAAGALEVVAVSVVHASGRVTGGTGVRGPTRRTARGGARPGAAGTAGG